VRWCPLLRWLLSRLFYLCQRLFRLWQPECHRHIPVHVNRCEPFTVGSLCVSCLDIQSTKAKMTVGLKRAHAEFIGQGEDEPWLGVLEGHEWTPEAI
jgi:hypothetical protein